MTYFITYQDNKKLNSLTQAVITTMLLCSSTTATYANTAAHTATKTTTSNTTAQQHFAHHIPRKIVTHTALGGEKLWYWLSEQLANTQQQYDAKSLVWETTAEKPTQAALKQNIITKLQKQAKNHKHTAQNQWLTHWIQSLPITGRVNLPLYDARLLQLNAKYSPILAKQDKVTLYSKSQFVQLISDDGSVCSLPHSLANEATDYVQACGIKADVAYVIQPDGSIHKQHIASWNETAAMIPAAGAVLWVPARANLFGSGVAADDKLAADIAKLIATQGMGIPLSQPLQQPSTANQSKKLAQAAASKSKDPVISSSNWGIIGLLQTPTARMRQAGNFAFNYSNNNPYSYYNISLQPFERLEVAMRYVDIADRLYGPNIAGDQSYKDKSLDVKLKLLDESYWLPALAMGFRDPIGTGLFNGEYIVANKRFSNVDVSLGLGFGYLGARGGVNNPFGLISDRFKNRVVDRAQFGGKPTTNSWFTGKGAFFGGIQWHTPYEPLSVKLEYDGNDYQNEPAGNSKFDVKSPVNIGLVWQQDNIDVSLAYERGNQVSAGITLYSNLANLVPARSKPKFLSALSTQSKSLAATQQQKTLMDFNKATGLNAKSIYKTQATWLVTIDNHTGSYLRKKIERGIAVLNRDASIDVTEFFIDIYEQNEKIQSIKIDRKHWLAQQTQLLPPSLQQDYVSVSAHNATSIIPRQYSYSVIPSLSQNFGGPDGYLYAVNLEASMYVPLWHNAWVDTAANLNILNNYSKWDYVARSELERVRTNFAAYATTSRLNMPLLQINQLYKATPSVYLLGYAGYLESMYAGVGGEIMYRPNQSSWAVSIDANHVKQREFDQHFGLRDYKTNTGHINFYWDTNWHGIQVKAKAGQYLAGDKGLTLDLSRKFTNGLEMGAWATKTDVSSAQFGEGSFDKGIYFTVPFEAFADNLAKSSAKFVWQPLIRDGGAMLKRSSTLWDITHSYDAKLLQYKTKPE